MIVTMAIRSQGQHVTPVIGGGDSWPWEKYTADNKNVTRGNVIVSVTTGAFGAPAPRPSPRDTGHNQSAQCDPSAPGLRVQHGSEVWVRSELRVLRLGGTRGGDTFMQLRLAAGCEECSPASAYPAQALGCPETGLRVWAAESSGAKERRCTHIDKTHIWPSPRTSSIRDSSFRAVFSSV